MRKIIILGSASKDGHTRKAVNQLRSLADFDIVDLNNYNISYYDYGHKNEKDDYLNLMRNIISNYDILIFATPVYWYSMSGIMKVFFDRITDLLDNEKELGRKLRGKSMAVLSSSIGDHLGDSFWLPFSETAKYLGMDYIGHIHTIENKVDMTELKKFADLIAKYETVGRL